MSVAVLTALSTGLQVVGTLQQAAASSSAAKANARIAENNAAISRQQGEEAAFRRRRDIAASLGRARVNAAASGAGTGGSVEDILFDSAFQGALDVATEKHNATIKAIGFEAEASVARAEAKNIKTAGYISAATQAGGGYLGYQRYKSTYGTGGYFQ